MTETTQPTESTDRGYGMNPPNPEYIGMTAEQLKTAMANDPAHPHSDKALLTIQHAIEGYKRKYPTASQDEIDDFTKSITSNVRARYHAATDLKEARRARIAAVAEKMKALGVHLATTRYCDRVPSDHTDAGYRYVVSPKGGLSAAYVYNDDVNVTTIALSVCSETDVFDRLDGRERSVERFEQGLVLAKDGKITDLDPLNLRTEYLQLLRDKGISPQQYQH